MRKRKIIDQFVAVLIVLFIIVWTIVVALDYANKHPAYFYGFKYFRYTGLVFQFVVLTGLFLLLHKFSAFFRKYLFNGIFLILIGFVTIFLIIRSHADLVNFSSTATDHGHFAFITLGSAFFVMLLLMICHAAGSFIYKKTLSDYVEPLPWLNIGLGMICLVMLMFFMGVFGLFNTIGLSFSLIILIIAGIKDLIPSLKLFFLRPIDLRHTGWLGLISAAVIFSFLLVNFVSIQDPFPSGFDSRNYYINISHLLAQSEELVKGYPPYNGSIFIALGLILSDTAELALSLSFVPIVLAIGIAFSFCRDKLAFTTDRSLFLLAMITVIPALTNQMFVELKVDFGLLFFQMLTVYYLFDAFEKLKKINLKDRSLRDVIHITWPFTALVGVLIGFGLGIKMINLFLVVVVIILIWWDKNNRYATAAALCLGLSLFLLAGIDNISGLRKYHLNVHVMVLLLGFFGMLFLIVSWLNHKRSTIRKIVFSAIIGFFALVFLMPWLVKNYTDTGTLDPRIMLMGDAPGPDLNLGQIKKNYERSKNDDQ